MTDPVTGADLVELREIADIHLVNVANAFASAIEQIHDADGTDRTTFVVPGVEAIGPGTSQAWAELRDGVDGLLRTTYRNLTATTEALHRLIEDYRATDDSLADAMQAEWDRNYDNEDYSVPGPPPVAPPPPGEETTGDNGTEPT